MSATAEEGLTLAKCSTCHARFAPREGPCPRCMATSVETFVVPGVGTVLAATALEVPPPGWASPHLLALVEFDDAVRLLVIAAPPLPAPGDRVQVVRDGPVYRARPHGPARGSRGEGDAPEAGSARPPFEPPR
jgi:uncharacterized OB-fold protein